MTVHSTAQGIASLGRHGDDMIVHMNRDEVKGLQALAQAHGASLSINPHTGMPEAFSLGGVFKSLLPVAAGFALGPGGFGLFDSALMAGLAVGAGTGLMTGNIGQGLMAGMGAYGGFGLGDTLAKLGTSTAGGLNSTMAANATQATTGAPLVGASSQFISPFTPQGIAGGAGLGVGTSGAGALSNQTVNAGLTGLNTAANINPVNVPTSGWDKSLQGTKNLFKPGGFDQLRNVMGTPVPGTPDSVATTYDAAGNVTGKTVTPGTAATIKPASVGQAAMKLATPIGGALLGGVEASDLNPNINLQGSGRTKHVQTGVDSSGKPIYGDIELTKYSPYETLNLNNPYGGYPVTPPPSLILPPTMIAKEGGMINSYAVGGVVSNPSVGGGLSDLYNRPEGQTTETISQDGYGIGRLNTLANAEAINTAKTLGYADGGTVAGDTGMNLDALPSLNLNTGTTNPGITAVITSNNNDGRRGPFGNAGINFGTYGRDDSSRGGGLFNAGVNFASDNRNGLSFRTIGGSRMAQGGYLDGQGDGMSDSIPATIEGKQPARLADGEFVIPADVVSHIGNGSSKAGSKRLYSMLDKVRKARTGSTKQGKQINPNKFLPA